MHPVCTPIELPPFGGELRTDADTAALGASAPGVACLSSHNCDTNRVKLSSKQRKRAHAISQNVSAFVEKYGVENCGFMTLTAPSDKEEKIDQQEMTRRTRNFYDRVLRPVVIASITVPEWTQKGNPHHHKLVAFKEDIRAGFNWAHYEALQAWNRDFRNPSRGQRPKGDLGRNAALCELHALVNGRRKNYSLGTIEIVPVKTSAEAIGFYLGGYLAKSLSHKPAGDRSRLVRYTKECPRPVRGDFMWTGPGSWIWRRKLMLWGKAHGCNDLDEVKQLCGPRWAYHHREAIEGMTLDYYPDLGIWTIDRGSRDAPPADAFPITVTCGDGSPKNYRSINGPEIVRRHEVEKSLNALRAIPLQQPQRLRPFDVRFMDKMAEAEFEARRGFEAIPTAPGRLIHAALDDLPGGGKVKPSPPEKNTTFETAPPSGAGGVRIYNLRPRPPLPPLPPRQKLLHL